ncbi:MAG: LysR family transcriptional regulator [Deltaproteobacteria bacterium]|nr:LysR family transcriptional regulator [Nannocystaceae bacterium]
MPRMDLLAQMQTFVRVVDGKSLSAAARAQRLSLAAVSRQLQALEAELGTSLVVRSTRRLHLTDAGERWYAHCIRVLREVEEARAAMRGDDVPRGTLVVSASLTFGQVVVIPILTALAERHPQLVVDLRLEDQLVDLVGEGVDVAIRAGSSPPDSTAYLARPIFAMTRVLVASPKWLRKHGTPRQPEQLGAMAALVQVTPSGTLVRWSLQRGDVRTTVEVHGGLRCNAPMALRDLAIAGAGIAYVPDWLVVDDLAEGRLRRVLPEWASAPINAWAIHRSELRGAAKLRAFLEALPSRAPG